MAKYRHAIITNHHRSVRISRQLFVATKLWRLRRLLARMLLWHDRARQRTWLRQLDTHALKDIGLTREKALRESAKPFWRD